jgi:hypothetical protein
VAECAVEKDSLVIPIPFQAFTYMSMINLDILAWRSAMPDHVDADCINLA